MKHYGDITKIDGSKVEPVDIVTGGSPCQDLSVAGKRKGLSGERSGLFMEQIRIIKEMRGHDRRNGRTDQFVRPRYMVWENVPGAFSSNDGEDFRAVLEETARIADTSAIIPRLAGGETWTPSGCIMGDGWSIAWRLHDAQFWGVPQRRKRIALVADFGGQSAPEILFERKGVSRDIAESGKERQGTAKDAEGCFGETDATFKVIGFNRERCGAVAMDDMVPTLQAAAGESGNNQPMAALSFQERAGKPGGGKGILVQNERTGALSTLNNQVVYGFNPGASRDVGVSKTLSNGSRPGHYNGVVYGFTYANDAYDKWSESEKGASLRASGGVYGGGSESLFVNSGVRRLTPLECERLQGFPDYWTNIGEWTDSKGKKHKNADSPRYKALGNSIALPFWEWMAKRMCSYIADHEPTMGSLFDGIGGFPLVFSRCGCKPVWASEIEEFPIAVTKYHFEETSA